jgi:hypothetical protein
MHLKSRSVENRWHRGVSMQHFFRFYCIENDSIANGMMIVIHHPPNRNYPFDCFSDQITIGINEFVWINFRAFS